MSSTAAALPGGGSGAGVETRRGLLAFFGWGTIALAALQGVVAFLFYFWPRKTGTFGSRISAGSPNDYKPGDVKYFVGGKFYLVRLAPDDAGVGAEAGGFVALYQKCPHVGCTVPWRPEFEFPYQGQQVRGLFRCPCHGSTYLKTGQIIFGPAPRPMDLMKISVEGGQLVVDTGTVRKRPQHEPSQAVRV
jgi:cytochrome b6-f complex iron-sulfur subunit